jgi:YHS domain-containing protein
MSRAKQKRIPGCKSDITNTVLVYKGSAEGKKYNPENPSGFSKEPNAFAHLGKEHYDLSK